LLRNPTSPRWGEVNRACGQIDSAKFHPAFEFHST
jgi:hypothetical protein